MVVKSESNCYSNVMETGFVGWWSNFDFMNEVEQRSLQAIKNQREWIEGTKDQMSQIEENSKHLTKDWKTSVQEVAGDNFYEWENILEEISHTSQSISFLPGKTSLNILCSMNDQFEQTLTSAISQQQKTREEFSKVAEDMIEQWKEAQMELFKPFQFMNSKSN